MLSQELLFQMLDNIPAGIFVVRLEEENDINSFRIVYSNDGTTRSTGISMKPFIGQMLKDVFPAVYEAGLPLKYMEALRTGKPIEIGELEYGDEKITKRTFLLSAIPFGKNHVIVHNENITDLKAAQVENTDLMSEIKKRQTIEEDLKQSNSEIKQFAYIASHDLQEPLQTIMSFITLLQEDYQGKFDPVADKYFEYINKSALRMRALITALLDYSRLGKDAEPSILETKNIVEELKTDLSKLIEKERVEINVGTLPEVFGYEVEMRQLFQNLVTNAIKFSHAERSPEISISAEQTGGNWTFSISDNGIGIDKIHLSKIFIIFKRLHRRDEYEGTGIGLAHCKKIVEMHNGKIWAESKPGLGSTFYFTIPQKLEL